MYMERVQIFEANEVSAEKCLSIFLSIISGSAYALLRNLLSPVSSKDKSLDEVIAILKDHYKPKPIIVEKFHFLSQSQLPGELVAHFIAELRRLLIHCTLICILRKP